jgi:predicted peptidase
MKKKLSMILMLVLCVALVFALSAVAMADDEVVAIGGNFDIYSRCYGYGEEVYSVVIDAEKNIESATVAPEDFQVTFVSRNFCGNLQTTTRQVKDVTVVNNRITLNLVMTGNGTNDAIDMENFSVTLVGEIADTTGVVYNGSEFVGGKQINPELDAMIEGGTEYENYRLYIPENTDEAAPLYIWLHGAGEFGDNNRTQVSCSNLVDWTQPEVQEIFDNSLYVMAIQSKASPHNPEYVMEAIMEVVNEYNIDKNRIYIAGCSMGGMGTNDMIRTYPDFFAAAIPDCPASVISPEDAAKLVDLPIIYVHALNDTTVRISNSIQSYNNIKAAGSEKIWCNFFSVNPNNPFTGRGYQGHWSWCWIHDNYTSTEEEFINGEGVYTRNDVEYPYVSTPLAEIGKGYANIAEWLADQEKIVTLDGEYYIHSTNYAYGEEADSFEIILDTEIDPDSVEKEDFEVYTVSRNRKSQRTIEDVVVDGDTITVYVGKTGSGVNSNAGSTYYIDLVGDIDDVNGAVYNADNFVFAGQINPAIDQFIEGETEHMKYRLFVPETEGKKPLIIWLHGGGEFGTDNRIHLAASNPTNYALPEYQEIFGDAGAYVLAPQSPAPKPHITSNIMETVYDVIEKYDVDETRIYVMGCSQGGKTTNELISENPNFFAAAISDCPYQSQITEEAAEKLTNFPIIYLHALNDTTAWPYESIESCRRLKEAGNETAWCLFYSQNQNNPVTGRAYMGHWSWTYLHENPTTEEEYFIDGEGVYTARDGTEYPYVSTPLSEIGKGYPDILTWLADQQNVGIKVGTETVDAVNEDTVAVDVTYTGDATITSAMVTLDSKLPIAGIVSDNDFEYNPDTGMIVVYSPDGQEISDPLFTINYNVDATVSDGEYPIVIKVIDVTDMTSGSIVVRGINGAVVVDNNYPIGDVSQDGEIDNRDLIMIARYLVGLVEFNEKQLEAADFNEDDIVNNTDLVLIARYIVTLGE